MLRVPTVSGKEAVCGAGIRGPQQTYLGEGLADSEIGRFLETRGQSSVSQGLGLSIVLSGTPPACKPQEVMGQKDPMIEPHLYLLCQLRCPPPASCLGS